MVGNLLKKIVNLTENYWESEGLFLRIRYNKPNIGIITRQLKIESKKYNKINTFYVLFMQHKNIKAI